MNPARGRSIAGPAVAELRRALMGIHPHRELIPTPTGYVELIRTPDVIHRRELVAREWNEERTNCFCCSCSPANVSSDPCCRNHGWWVVRPCELHNMPGEPDDNGAMPVSVQEYRRRIEQRQS